MTADRVAVNVMSIEGRERYDIDRLYGGGGGGALDGLDGDGEDDWEGRVKRGNRL
jgi:hypothetical protein